MLIKSVSDDDSTGKPSKGLRGLRQVALNEQNQQLLDAAEAGNRGDAAWQGRKCAETRDLLALAQIAPPGRLKVGMLDLRADLRAVLLMRVPVPCRPDEDSEARWRSPLTTSTPAGTFRSEAATSDLPLAER